MSTQNVQNQIKRNLEIVEKADYYLSLSEESLDTELTLPSQHPEISLENEDEGGSVKVTRKLTELGLKLGSAVFGGVKRIKHTAAQNLRPRISQWKQDNELAREHAVQNFSERRALSNKILSRLSSVAQNVESTEDATITIKGSRLRNFVHGEALPPNLVHAIRDDAQKESNDFHLIIDQQKNALKFLTQLFDKIDTSSDSQFAATFVQDSSRLDAYNLDHAVKHGGARYLGNKTLLLDAALKNDLPFIADYAQRNNFHFRTQSIGFDPSSEVTFSKRDIVELIDASRRYLSALEGTDKLLLEQQSKFQELLFNAFLIESGEHPKHVLGEISKYRDIAMHLQEYILPNLSNFDRVLAPMYADMQRKAMALMHLAEQWYVQARSQG